MLAQPARSVAAQTIVPCAAAAREPDRGRESIICLDFIGRHDGAGAALLSIVIAGKMTNDEFGKK